MPPTITFEPEYLRLPLALQIFFTAWFFYLGGCIGSFMNVVIFRLPRGRSVVSPPSRCPQCGSNIRWYDNLPVLSWLLLRGRCRDCRIPIPARYPLVELLMGLIFMTLAVEAFMPGGPWWLLNIEQGEILSVPWPKLALAYAYYALLLCTLVGASYMAWDGERVPRRLFLPALLAGALVPLYWNEVRWLGHSRIEWTATLLSGLREGAAGAALGLVLGLAFDTVRDLRNAAGEPRGRITLALFTCGWLLGLQTVVFTALVAPIASLAWFLISGRRWRSACAAPLVGVTVTTLILTLAGRFVFERRSPWPVAQTWLLLGALGILLTSAWLLRWMSPPAEVDETAVSQPNPLDVIYP